MYQWLATAAVKQQAQGQAAVAIDSQVHRTRLRLGLWLYLEERGRAYRAVQELADKKKYPDFQLLNSVEAITFGESGEFSDLNDAFALESYWQDRRPDRKYHLAAQGLKS